MGTDIIVADSSPYPEVRVSGENKQFGEQLCAALGGSGGEFGTISEYVYQSVIFEQSYPETARIFSELAKVEMHHLRMITELVNKLGATPVYGWYSGKEPVYWNGSSVNYTRELHTALIHDLNGEQKAYSAYVSLARQSGDRYVFAVLTRIALDEMIHTSLLKSLISRRTMIPKGKSY